MFGTMDAALSGGIERAVAYTRGDRGILGAIRGDRARITTLFNIIARQIDETGRRARVLATASRELRAHLGAEAETLYPRWKRVVGGDNPLRQSEREHEEILGLADELQSMPPADPGWEERFEALQRLVALHFQDEEDQLFPAVRRELQRSERNALAESYVSTRDALQGRPPPAQP